MSVLRFATSITLYPTYPYGVSPLRDETDHDVESLAHLEVQIKFADDLGSIWAVDGYGVDWKVGSLEGPFCCRLRCDHGGMGDVPRNGLFRIAPTGNTDSIDKLSITPRTLLGPWWKKTYCISRTECGGVSFMRDERWTSVGFDSLTGW